MVLSDSQELHSYSSSFVKEHEDRSVEVVDEDKLREAIDTLCYTAVFSDNSSLRHETQTLIRKMAASLGARPSSIQPLYKAFGEGEVHGFSVPAMNIRMMNYDFSQAVFTAAQSVEAGTFIFQIAPSEMQYSDQTPGEFSAVVCAAAIKTGWRGPIFIQGDHFQFKEEAFRTTPQQEIDRIELLVKDALMAQFYNIDIDASTLVDLTKDEVDDQQRDNYEMTGLLTKYIRDLQPPGVTVAMGGEIGHIGGVDSTVADFQAFMKGYEAHAHGITPIVKVSVQTGTSHGGTPDENGAVKAVDVDFSVLQDISRVARDEYKMAGAVQHGASTLSDSQFKEFVKHEAVEVHLATGFQNIIMEHLPSELLEKMNTWVMENCGDERDSGWNDAQFMYKLRKKAVGPFKKECWDLPEEKRTEIRSALTDKVATIFEAFNIAGTAHTVRQHIGSYVS